MLKKVKLSSIKPNPYRCFETYPIKKEKIATLTESFEASGFWGETVIARQVGSEYELAFGHHRWQAALKHYGSNKLVEISVRKLSNEQMLKMMARENSEMFVVYADQDIELVQAAIKAHAEGEICLPAPEKKSNGVTAKGIDAKNYSSNCKFINNNNFTRQGLQEFLGLPKMYRVTDALQNIKLINEGAASIDDYRELKPTQAHELTRQVTRVKGSKGKATAKKVAKQIGQGIRTKTLVAGIGSGTVAKKTAKALANKVINKGKPEPMPDIAAVCLDMSKELSKILAPGSRQYDIINEITKNQKWAETADIYRVKMALKSLATRATTLAKKLNAPDIGLAEGSKLNVT